MSSKESLDLAERTGSDWEDTCQNLGVGIAGIGLGGAQNIRLDNGGFDDRSHVHDSI